jgi:N-acetylglucosaminyl-diphospho-decaprenol L-rhamnosyltransferase
MMVPVVINYNTARHLRACLGSLRAAGAMQVIVKDNGSTDGSVEMIRREFPEVVVHPDFENVGYGAAANLGIAACNTPYVLLLNSDTIVPPGAIDTLRRYLDNHPDVAIVGPRLNNEDGTLQRSAHHFPRPFTLRPLVRLIPGLRERSLLTWAHDVPREVDWVKGAALAIRRSAFDDVGGFDPAFFMYFEETDLCARLAKEGWKTHFSPAAVVLHTGGASTAAVASEMAVQFWRSMRRFYRIHYGRTEQRTLEAVLTVTMGAYLLRDSVRLSLNSDPVARARLRQDMHVWSRVMRDENDAGVPRLRTIGAADH